MGYIVGSGSYLPGQEPVTNKMLSEIFGESMNLAGDYFGVTSRNFAVDYRTGENIGNEYNSDFCYKAVKQALHKVQMPPQEIGLLITATSTPDYALPQMSTLIQEKMGFKDLITFDLRGGCSAPLQGIFIAESFIKNGLVKNAIVVGSEDFSGTYYHFLLKNKNNYLVKDLMSSLIFGDGAAAVVVSKNKIGDQSLDIEDIVSQSSFAHWPTGFRVALSGSKIRHLGDADISLGQMMKHFPKEIETYLPKVTKTVFEKIYAKRNYIPEDFKYIVGPQANPRLVDYLNKKFNISNYFYNGDVTGNIPGGALLLALDKLLQKHHLAPKDKIIILGVESSKWLYGYCILNRG